MDHPSEAISLQLAEVAPERFNELAASYVIGRSQGVALGKLIPAPLNLIQVGPWVMYPAAGISYQADDVAALHASSQQIQTTAVPVFEFDFTTQPLGLSLAPVQSDEPVETARRIIAEHAGLPVGTMELEAWRATQARQVKLCPCCVQSAAQRTLFPWRHPMTRILRHAKAHQVELMARVESPHFQVSATFIPAQLSAEKGWVVCSNEENTLHLNLALVHAIWIGVRKMDDEPFTQLKLISVTGSVMVELASRDVELAAIWQRICHEEEGAPSN